MRAPLPLECLDLPVLLRADSNLQMLEERSFDTERGRLVVPRGFRSDLATVPFFLRGLIPNAGRRVNLAAILHDWCCEHLKARLRAGQTLDDRDPDGPMYGPIATDVMFRKTLIGLGLPLLMAWIMWSGVRLGAVFSPYRRPGWLRTLPQLLLVILLTGWLTIPFGLVALVGVCLYLLTETVVAVVVGFGALVWGTLRQSR